MHVPYWCATDSIGNQSLLSVEAWSFLWNYPGGDYVGTSQWFFSPVFQLVVLLVSGAYAGDAFARAFKGPL